MIRQIIALSLSLLLVALSGCGGDSNGIETADESSQALVSEAPSTSVEDDPPLEVESSEESSVSEADISVISTPEPQPSQAESQESSQPTYEVASVQGSYPVATEEIQITITNTSAVEGGYGYYYRIERKDGEDWVAIPLDFDVMSIAAILYPGQSNTERFSLYQEQYDYTAGQYRIVLMDIGADVSAGFVLE